MGSQCTKFEVSRFTRYEAMNGNAKCKMGWFGVVRGALKVMGNATIRQSAYDFLFGLNRKYVSIFYRFYRAMLCIRGTSHGPVSVSVRQSVTSRSSTKTAKHRITQTTPHDTPKTLVF